MGLCCPLSSEFVIFYSVLWLLVSPLGFANNTARQISLTSFYWPPSYKNFKPQKTACVHRRRPPPLLLPTHCEALDTNTRGQWSAGRRKVARGWGRPHYQPAGWPSRPPIAPPLFFLTPIAHPPPSQAPVTNENNTLLSGSKRNIAVAQSERSRPPLQSPR